MTYQKKPQNEEVLSPLKMGLYMCNNYLGFCRGFFYRQLRLTDRCLLLMVDFVLC